MMTDIIIQKKKGLYLHSLGPAQKEYYDQLSRTAKIENIPETIIKISKDALKQIRENPSGFRENHYTIDDGIVKRNGVVVTDD